MLTCIPDEWLLGIGNIICNSYTTKDLKSKAILCFKIMLYIAMLFLVLYSNYFK